MNKASKVEQSEKAHLQIRVSALENRISFRETQPLNAQLSMTVAVSSIMTYKESAKHEFILSYHFDA